MDQFTWDAIFAAVEIVGGGKVNKVEGKGWKVYRVVKIVRVDIEESYAK